MQYVGSVTEDREDADVSETLGPVDGCGLAVRHHLKPRWSFSETENFPFNRHYSFICFKCTASDFIRVTYNSYGINDEQYTSRMVSE